MVLFQRFMWLVCPNLSLLFGAARSADKKIVGFPKVRKAGLVAQSFRDACPKHLATLHTMVSNVKGNDLTRLATNYRPEPPLLTFFLTNAVIRRTPARLAG
jgi:hypothetical protein